LSSGGELFDGYADSYQQAVERSIAFAGGDVDRFTRRKARHLLDVAQRRLGDPGALSALDVGCGVGATDRHLVRAFGELHGVDTAAEAVQRAALANPEAIYAAYEGIRLPYEDGRFDLAFAICVVHHVSPPGWSAFAAELGRVVRPGGIVALFEHNPVNPLTRFAVSRCEFDEDATLLSAATAAGLLSAAGLDVVERRHIVFFPWDRPRSRTLERALAWVPAGAQHYVAARRPIR